MKSNSRLVLGFLALSAIIIALAVGFRFHSSLSGIRFGATNPTDTPIALFETSLASGITSTQTTMTLVSGLTQDGTTLASSTYGFIIDQGSANQEFVRADCTNVTCTNITRGISVITGTSSISALMFSHRRGASVKITDAPILLQLNNLLTGTSPLPYVLSYLGTPSFTAASSTSGQIPDVSWVFNNFVDKASPQTISGLKTFSTAPQSSVVCSSGNDYCNKTYIDAQVVAGGTDATYTVKGVTERATVAEINSGATGGGTTAPLFMSPSDFANSNYASSTVFKYSTTSVQQLATTTISGLGAIDVIHFWFHASSTVPSNSGRAKVTFNGDATGTNYAHAAYRTDQNSTGSYSQTTAFIDTFSPGDDITNGILIDMTIYNTAGDWKYGTWNAYLAPGVSLSETWSGAFVWKNNTSRITSISVSTGPSTFLFATSTIMSVTGF